MTSTEQQRVEEIAGRLSRAQSEWIVAMPTIPTSMSPEAWDAMPAFYTETSEGETWFAHAKASYYGDGGPWMLSAQLTPLGLLVRAHLQEQAS